MGYGELIDALVKPNDGVWWNWLVLWLKWRMETSDGVDVRWTSIGSEMGSDDELKYGLLVGMLWDDIGYADELVFGYAGGVLW